MGKLENEILFAKKNDSVKIPTKREEDAGFDIYANFEEDYIIINPHETKMIPTGLCSAFSSDYVAVLKERGSTGTKGIGQRAGIIDSGFRSEWWIPITNHNDNVVIIAKEGKLLIEEDTVLIPSEFGYVYRNLEQHLPIKNAITYPYEKAIAQAIMIPVPKLHTKEVTMDELLSYESERGSGALGSSGK